MPQSANASKTPLPQIAIATLHQKERWLAPALSKTFDPQWAVVAWNTDQLGTFSGEIDRRGGAAAALEAKLEAAAQGSDAPWLAASEGSYGPHPSLPWLNIAEEHLWIRERATGHTWKQKLRDLAPFARSWNLDRLPLSPQDIHIPWDELSTMPGQAFLLKLGEKSLISTRKNLRNHEEIQQGIQALWRHWVTCPLESLILQTELRAHLCPGRQQLLGRLAEIIAVDLQRPCPACQTPGWTVIGKEPGLPCEICTSPTHAPGFILHACPRCGHQERTPIAGFADAGCCGFCNP